MFKSREENYIPLYLFYNIMICRIGYLRMERVMLACCTLGEVCPEPYLL